jgi:hypothetical protein
MTEDSATPGIDRAQAGPAAPPDRAPGSWVPGDGLEQQPSGAASACPAESGRAGPALRSHSRTRWLVIAIVAVLVLLGGAGIWRLATAHRAGNIVLPGTLLGLSRYTGPGARALEHKIENAGQTGSGGILAAPVAAVYGDPDGPGFAVVAGAPCTGGTCVIGTAGQFVQALRADGYADARSFPPGPGGDILACHSQPFESPRFISCVWIDQVSGGEVVFGGGSASGLADAAAKTRQIRAAIEH